MKAEQVVFCSDLNFSLKSSRPQIANMPSFETEEMNFPSPEIESSITAYSLVVSRSQILAVLSQEADIRYLLSGEMTKSIISQK